VIESWIIKWIYNFTCQVGEEYRKSAKVDILPVMIDIQGDGGAIDLPFYFRKRCIYRKYHIFLVTKTMFKNVYIYTGTSAKHFYTWF
jgi:hypothetical protein